MSETHTHWCSIRGHWFEASCEHDPDYVGTKETGGPIELRSDCPECAGFHWWKVPRWIGFFWRYWICSQLTQLLYWNWRCSLLKCSTCGVRIEKNEAKIRAIFHACDDWQCGEHRPKPHCPCGCSERDQDQVIGWCLHCDHVYFDGDDYYNCPICKPKPSEGDE